MLQGEHSAILSTLIKLPFVIKTFFCLFLSGRFTQVLLYMKAQASSFAGNALEAVHIYAISTKISCAGPFHSTRFHLNPTTFYDKHRTVPTQPSNCHLKFIADYIFFSSLKLTASLRNQFNRMGLVVTKPVFRFPTKRDSNQFPRLQRPARILKIRLKQVEI